MTDLLRRPDNLEPDSVRPGLPTRLPAPRGPLSEHLLFHLQRPSHEISPLPPIDVDVLVDDDGALALHLLYELSYLGLAGVDEAWETEPSVLRERNRLEQAFEERLVELMGPVPIALCAEDVQRELQGLASAPSRRSISSYLAADGTLDQLRELAIHRSAYQLKEADGHTWAIPRLTGRAKAALVDIQRGEYGNGQVHDVHANLFATVLSELGLDPTYGAHIDRLPGITLTTDNLVSFFGLHRRRRAPLVGHLALFEMCSVVPMGRYAAALRRLGVGERAARFYDEHVNADSRHQVVALEEMVMGLLEDEPLLGGEVVWGARALDAVERRFAEHVLDSWEAGRSSLR